MSKIVVFGSLNMDLAISAPKLPQPGETVLARSMRYTPGGKGANQAVSAARMGGVVHFVGSVGRDEHGQKLVTNLANEGIDTAAITVTDDAPTGLAVVAVDDTGENSIIVVPGANYAVGAGEIAALRAVIRPGDMFVAQLELPHEVVAEALQVARSAGAYCVLNAAPAADVTALLQSVDLLIVNETEAALLVGHDVRSIDDAAAAAAELYDRFAATVIVTCGEAGSVGNGPAGPMKIPAFPVTAVDTTGAGDAFVGALVVALGENRILDDATRLAAAAGAAAATKSGAQDALPTKSEVFQMFGVQ